MVTSGQISCSLLGDNDNMAAMSGNVFAASLLARDITED